jgi:hypothetical protein
MSVNIILVVTAWIVLAMGLASLFRMAKTLLPRASWFMVRTYLLWRAFAVSLTFWAPELREEAQAHMKLAYAVVPYTNPDAPEACGYEKTFWAWCVCSIQSLLASFPFELLNSFATDVYQFTLLLFHLSPKFWMVFLHLGKVFWQVAEWLLVTSVRVLLSDTLAIHLRVRLERGYDLWCARYAEAFLPMRPDIVLAFWLSLFTVAVVAHRVFTPAQEWASRQYKAYRERHFSIPEDLGDVIEGARVVSLVMKDDFTIGQAFVLKTRNGALTVTARHVVGEVPTSLVGAGEVSLREALWFVAADVAARPLVPRDRSVLGRAALDAHEGGLTIGATYYAFSIGLKDGKPCTVRTPLVLVRDANASGPELLFTPPRGAGSVPGMSGAPVVDDRRRVVGVLTGLEGGRVTAEPVQLLIHMARAVERRAPHKPYVPGSKEPGFEWLEGAAVWDPERNRFYLKFGAMARYAEDRAEELAELYAPEYLEDAPAFGGEDYFSRERELREQALEHVERHGWLYDESLAAYVVEAPALSGSRRGGRHAEGALRGWAPGPAFPPRPTAKAREVTESYKKLVREIPEMSGYEYPAELGADMIKKHLAWKTRKPPVSLTAMGYGAIKREAELIYAKAAELGIKLAVPPLAAQGVLGGNFLLRFYERTGGNLDTEFISPLGRSHGSFRSIFEDDLKFAEVAASLDSWLRDVEDGADYATVFVIVKNEPTPVAKLDQRGARTVYATNGLARLLDRLFGYPFTRAHLAHWNVPDSPHASGLSLSDEGQDLLRLKLSGSLATRSRRRKFTRIVSLDVSGMDDFTDPQRHRVLLEHIRQTSPGAVTDRQYAMIQDLYTNPLVVLPDGSSYRRLVPGGTASGLLLTNAGHTVEMVACSRTGPVHPLLATGDDIVLAVPDGELSTWIPAPLKDYTFKVESEASIDLSEGEVHFCSTELLSRRPLSWVKMVVRAINQKSPTAEQEASLLYELRHHPGVVDLVAAMRRAGWSPNTNPPEF